MLDYHPLHAIPGTDRPTTTDDRGVFVAKLRYQQTKVDGVDPTILVEGAVVHVIAEQQQWVAEHHPGLVSKYLFIGRRQQHNGQGHRPYSSYQESLTKLDKLQGLTDAAGNPLRFSQTHRLRHTRATELLNDGVPIHVVQRYLGHKRPEMTKRYAATLSATAEAEFLKTRRSARTAPKSRSAPPTSTTGSGLILAVHEVAAPTVRADSPLAAEKPHPRPITDGPLRDI